MKSSELIINILIIYTLLFSTSSSILSHGKIVNEKYCDNNVKITIDKIFFDWGEDSKSITLMDSNTESVIAKPEYDRNAKRNNPVAYIRGTNFSIKVKIKSNSLDKAVIKAMGDFNGTFEKEVTFLKGE